MSRESIVFFASETLAEKLKTEAQERGVSTSALVREAVATYLDYDLESEPATERRTKYASKAEREKAARARAADKRKKQKALMDAIKRGENQDAIMALARSLVGKSETADAIVEAEETK